MMLYQKNINNLLYIIYIMSLTLKQETIVTEGNIGLSNGQPTPTKYNNFPVSKLLIIDKDNYLIASQQISQDEIEEDEIEEQVERPHKKLKENCTQRYSNRRISSKSKSG